jgi:xanthine dehydrogenase accessory factor
MTKHETLRKALARQDRAVLVEVTQAVGSTPREAGAWMIVTAEGFHGTIGGGTLEWKALASAQKHLQRSDKNILHESYSLGPDLGQCCGGRVQLSMRLFDKTDSESIPNDAPDDQRTVYLFGAGHTGRALMLALAPLPFHVVWIDPRPNAFPSVTPQNVTIAQEGNPSAGLDKAAEGSLAFVMTHSHALDLEIVDAALRNASIAHVGLIGSATKRARFEKRLREAGVTEPQLAKLICPIGVAGIRSKRPVAIAAATVAQILILDEALAQGNAIEYRQDLSA